jgi:hypothetical protein
VHQDMTPKQSQQRTELLHHKKEPLAKGEKNLITVDENRVVKKATDAQVASILNVCT